MLQVTDEPEELGCAVCFLLHLTPATFSQPYYAQACREM